MNSEFPAFLSLKNKQEFFCFFGCRDILKTSSIRSFVLIIIFLKSKLHEPSSFQIFLVDLHPEDCGFERNKSCQFSGGS